MLRSKFSQVFFANNGFLTVYQCTAQIVASGDMTFSTSVGFMV